MADSPPLKPVSEPDALTEPFFAAGAEGRLLLATCDGCGEMRLPTSPACPSCLGEGYEWNEVSGRGTVFSYTVMRQQNVGGFEGDVPYVTLLVELEEQPQLFMLSFLPGSAAAQLAVGQSVEVVFEEVDEGMVLPQFRIDS